MEKLTTPERQLLQQAGEYDSRALAEIYDRYSRPVYNYLYRRVGDAHRAEDLTSEVFLKLLKALNTSKAPREHLQGWLYRVAHNLAVDWFRRNGGREASSLPESLQDGSELPPAVLQRRETQQRLRTAIGRLTVDQQQVILLRFGEGFKLAEVAHLVGRSEGAVKQLQYRAIRRLRKLLDMEGAE
jgi:RNA polymerase sigma-70 factor (ECF subfamily)